MHYANTSYNHWEFLWCHPILTAGLATDLHANKFNLASITVTLTSVIDPNHKNHTVILSLFSIKCTKKKKSFFNLLTS